MFKYTVSYLTLTIISGILGFYILTGTAEVVAKGLFGTALVLFLGSLLYDPKRRCSEI